MDNKPLTLEELLKIDGEPVYLQFGDGGQGWGILCADGDTVTIFGPMVEMLSHEEPDTDFLNMESNDPCGHYGLHLLGWRAYRNKPEEGE